MVKPTRKPKDTKKQKPAEKKKYKVRNWKEYNQSLVDRGKVCFGVADEAIEKWQEQQKTGKRGKPRVFSDIAIQTALTLQQVFQMPLRQTGGIKVYGEGEGKVRKHGWSKRRTWKRLHIGVDEETGDILRGEVTGNDKADGDVLDIMLEQVPAKVDLDQFSEDGAYDKRKCYDALRNRSECRSPRPLLSRSGLQRV